MLNIRTTIRLTPAVARAANLCDRFTPEDLSAIGNWAAKGYEADEQSRLNWYRRMEKAMDLAMQVVEDKNFPWPGASNVKFPLVTVAALQFHARAYPAIIHGPDLIKYNVVGPDPDGTRADRARRVGQHMSNQLLEVDQGWEESMDRLLINLPIVGCAFKKSFHSVSKGHTVSELVFARDLVMDYYAKSVEDCARVTHLIPLYRNDIYERCVSGVWRDITDEAWFRNPSTYVRPNFGHQQDNREGMTPPPPDEATPFMFGEQTCLMDLDDDGYAEPYRVTFELTTKTVVRIVANWDDEIDIERNKQGRIIRIRKSTCYTKYGFIPAPDGGIYDIGFGILLGPLNKSVDSLINQLIDAGTMATTAGGFLGRGVKIRGGKLTFSPLEWQKVDSTGDDLRKDIVPLPVREPSAVLLSLLSLLVDYSNRIPGTTDIMVGENIGQNTPAETARSMVEQGSKIYTALFKRVWRCLKNEVKQIYILNAKYMPVEPQPFGTSGTISREDYMENADYIVPSADPTAASDQVRLQRIMAIKASAATTPGYNVIEVEREYLRALGVDGIDRLYPGPEKMPAAPDPRAAIEAKKLEVKQLQIQADTQKFIAQLMEERRVNNAKIVELHARSALELSQADAAQDSNRIAAFKAAVEAMQTHDQNLLRMIDSLQKGMNSEQPSIEPLTQQGRMGSVADTPRDIGPETMDHEAAEGLAGGLDGGEIPGHSV